MSYIAGDFSKYSNKDCSKKFEVYIQGIKQWAESDYSHPKVKAIYTYIDKKRVIQDLISCGIVTLTETGKMDKKKIQGASMKKYWCVFE